MNAVCRLMRQHVTVALSGDGGMAFGGYDFYWQIARIVNWQRVPLSAWRHASAVFTPLSHLGIVRPHLSQRAKEIAGADDTSIIQDLFCWIRDEEHRRLCLNRDALPVRRLFECQWHHQRHDRHHAWNGCRPMPPK